MAKLKKEMKQRASFGGAVQNLNADIVRDLEIAVPPLSVQENIVKILDRFDKLNNDNVRLSLQSVTLCPVNTYV